MKINPIGHLVKTNPILSAVGGLQMNVSFFYTMAYENKSNWTLGQNKPNSNPILSAVGGFRKPKMNVNLTIIKDYRQKDDFSVRINKPNLVRRRRIPKMNVNLTLAKDYRKNDCLAAQKTNPIQTQSCPP